MILSINVAFPKKETLSDFFDKFSSKKKEKIALKEFSEACKRDTLENINEEIKIIKERLPKYKEFTKGTAFPFEFEVLYQVSEILKKMLTVLEEEKNKKLQT